MEMSKHMSGTLYDCPSPDERQKVMDLRGELRATILEAMKQGNETILKVAADALTDWCVQHYQEAGVVREEFPELFCGWCGRPHRSPECNAQLQKYYERYPDFRPKE